MNETSTHNLTINRTLHVPLARVWKAWTDPVEIAQWWGPQGVTNKDVEWDVRPGGKMYDVMVAGSELGELAGQEWPMAGEFKEIVPNKKLVFTSQAIMDGKPILENEVTVTFEDQGDTVNMKIEIVVTKITPEAAFALEGMESGWNQSIDKLVEHVS